MTFEHTEEVREARQAAYDAIEAAKAGAVAPGASLLSERQIARALSLNSKPRTWNELGDVVSLLNPAGGLKLNTEATKAISVALQIPACDVRAAFDVFMWSMTPPARPVPVIRKGCPS